MQGCIERFYLHNGLLYFFGRLLIIPMNRINRLKKIRLHREGAGALVISAIFLVILNSLVFHLFATKIPFYILAVGSVIVYGLMINFFQCPVRLFEEDTEKTVVAPADGRVVVIQEVEETEYLHERRIMISIFMSLFNVHANWYPVDGIVRKVDHQDGRFRKAYLPKASTENERSAILIETPEGVTILARQIAGAVARRIVTYANEGENCFIDEHMGFIKFGSRVDVYLPLNTEVCVKIGQTTMGNQTVIARLK